MSTIRIKLADMPAVIRESVRCVLISHGLDIVPTVRGSRIGLEFVGEPLDEKHLEILLREIGNNVAQALIVLDLDADQTTD